MIPMSCKFCQKRGLKNALQQFCIDDRVRCVVRQPNDVAISSDHTSDGHRLTPLERLWQVLKPEMSDLWIVIVFAFVVSLLMLATPIAVEALVNTVAFGRFLQPIIILAVILLTFLGFQGAVRALQTYVVEIIQRRLLVRIAGDLGVSSTQKPMPKPLIETTCRKLSIDSLMW